MGGGGSTMGGQRHHDEAVQVRHALLYHLPHQQLHPRPNLPRAPPDHPHPHAPQLRQLLHHEPVRPEGELRLPLGQDGPHPARVLAPRHALAQQPREEPDGHEPAGRVARAQGACPGEAAVSREDRVERQGAVGHGKQGLVAQQGGDQVPLLLLLLLPPPSAAASAGLGKMPPLLAHTLWVCRSGTARPNLTIRSVSRRTSAGPAAESSHSASSSRRHRTASPVSSARSPASARARLCASFWWTPWSQ